MNILKGVRNWFFKDDVRERKPSSGASKATSGTTSTPATTTPIPYTTRPRTQNRQGRDTAARSSAAELSNGNDITQHEGILKELPEGVSGGMQGLSWYAARQRQDVDGDIAEEFFVESEPLRKGGPRTFKKMVSSKTKKLSVLETDQGNIVLARA